MLFTLYCSVKIDLGCDNMWDYLVENQSAVFLILGAMIAYFGRLIQDYINNLARINGDRRIEMKNEVERIIHSASNLLNESYMFLYYVQIHVETNEKFGDDFIEKFNTQVTNPYNLMTQELNKLVHHKIAVNQSILEFCRSCELFIDIREDLINRRLKKLEIYFMQYDNMMNDYYIMRKKLNKFI